MRLPSITSMNQTGVYIIRHNPSGLFYIGSTGGIALRRTSHESHLRKGDHYSPSLQAAYNAGGSLSWDFTPTQTRQQAFELEKQLLDQHRGNPLLCNQRLNVGARTFDLISPATRQKIAEAHLGRRHSEEAKRRMSETRKGRPVSEAAQAASIEATRRPIRVDGVTYSTVSDAARSTGVSIQTLLYRARNAKPKFSGYVLVDKTS